MDATLPLKSKEEVEQQKMYLTKEEESEIEEEEDLHELFGLSHVLIKLR